MQPGQRAAGAPRRRPAGRLPAQPVPVEQGAEGDRRRPRVVGRAAPGVRPRGGDPKVRPGRVLDDRRRARQAGRRTALHGPAQPPSQRAGRRRPRRPRTSRSSWSGPRPRPRSSCASSRARATGSSASRRSAAPRARTCLTSPPPCSRTRRAACASAPRRTMRVAQDLYEGIELGRRGRDRSDHLHAHRLDAHLGRSRGEGEGLDQREVRRQVHRRSAYRQGRARARRTRMRRSGRPTSTARPSRFAGT